MAKYSKTRDVKWSHAVIALADWKCSHCNRSADAPHHIIPRGNRRTRYILENGINTCYVLHRLFEGVKIKREKAINIFIGRQRYKNLLAISNGQAKPEDFGYTVIK